MTRARLSLPGWRRLWWGVALLVASACATLPPAAPRVERGIASWYGPSFHGRFTASGERYDMHELTAAHRLHPFGTRLRVTNLENGRTVVVRVNDRGPFIRGRVIDLSLAAASSIGMVEKGTARVRLERLTGPAPAGESVYTVQVGAFLEEATARRLEQELRGRYPDVFIVTAEVEGLIYHRVRVGRMTSIDAADLLARRLDRDGLTVFVTRQDPEPMVR